MRREEFGLIDWPEMESRAAEILMSIGAEISPSTKLSDLGDCQQALGRNFACFEH